MCPARGDIAISSRARGYAADGSGHRHGLRSYVFELALAECLLHACSGGLCAASSTSVRGRLRAACRGHIPVPGNIGAATDVVLLHRALSRPRLDRRLSRLALSWPGELLGRQPIKCHAACFASRLRLTDFSMRLACACRSNEERRLRRAYRISAAQSASIDFSLVAYLVASLSGGGEVA
jgi:hypothetical protein